MIAWIKGIWAVVKASSWMASALKIGGLIVAGLLAVLVVLGKAKDAGRKDERLKQRDKALGNVKERNDVEDRVRREPRPADRLRERWSRD